MEELGVESEIGEMFYSEQSLQVSAGESHVFLMYKAALANPAQEFTLDPHEIQEIRWVGPDELRNQEIYPNYLRALEAYFSVR
jgi:isopentenyldiphosphate isomerase